MSIGYIDWGGTHFRCVVEGSRPVSFEKPSQDVDIVHELKTLFLTQPDLSRIGISFAGQVKDDVILSAPNIAAKELDLGAIFKDKTIHVQNDLKCAALAEAAYWNEKNIAVLYVGTGIGSAYIDNGVLVQGCDNLAGEIGHVPYLKTGGICGCGKDNCLELSASGSGIAKKAAAKGLQSRTLSELKQSEAGEVIVGEFIEAVGYGASMIVTLLNPKILVIGGGIVHANEWLLEHIKKYILKNGFQKSVEACDIKLSKLKNGSLEGARLLAI